MLSRLSSLLVRDGHADVAQIERAFRRQVMHGGSLDTALLELGYLEEKQLLEYLSLATGLPAAGHEADTDPNGARDLCSKELAEKYAVVPVTVSEGSLQILVADPVDLPKLEELATEIGLAVQPQVVPEYRLRAARARVYEEELDARWSELVAQNGDVPTIGVNAHTAPVTVDARRDTAVFEAVADPTLEEPSEDPAAAADAAYGAEPTEEPEAPAPKSRKRTQTQELSTTALKQRNTAREFPAQVPPEDAPADAAAPEDAGATVQMAAMPDMELGEEPAPADRAPDPSEALALAVGSDRLSPQLALAALQASEDRDQIFELLLKGMRSRAAYAGLLSVKGKKVVGRMSLCASAFELDEIEKVEIPLEGDSPYKRAQDSGAPVIGPLATGDQAIDAMSSRMGGTVPNAALLLPISVRGRVVAIAVAHSGPKSKWVSRVGDLLPLATATADAISRLLMAKAKGKKGSVPEPVDDSPTERVDVESAPVKVRFNSESNDAASIKARD